MNGIHLIKAVVQSETHARFELICDDCGAGHEAEELAVCLMMVHPQHQWPHCKKCGTTLTLMQIY